MVVGTEFRALTTIDQRMMYINSKKDIRVMQGYPYPPRTRAMRSDHAAAACNSVEEKQRGGGEGRGGRTGTDGGVCEQRRKENVAAVS